MRDPITCQPEIRWEDASIGLRCRRRCYLPYFVARAVWNIGIWFLRGAPIEEPLTGMTRWQITKTAWNCFMSMYEVGVKRQYLTIDQAMAGLTGRAALRRHMQ